MGVSKGAVQRRLHLPRGLHGEGAEGVLSLPSWGHTPASVPAPGSARGGSSQRGGQSAGGECRGLHLLVLGVKGKDWGHPLSSFL